jgi:hypothetical protein
LGVFINGDIASVIFPYLDVRELYNLAFSNKTLLATLRHKHVVRSALLHGGHAKTTASSICRLVEDRKIYIPSPRRFLCMVNGKHCERKGCKLKGNLNVARHDHGLFMCWGCCQMCTKRVTRNKKWAPLLENPRTAGASCGFGLDAYILHHAYRDTVGDLAGPIVAISDLERVDHLEQILQERDALDPHVSDAEEIVRTWKDSKEDAVTREKEREQAKKQKTTDADKSRREKTSKMLETLARFLENKEWKDFVLAHFWQDLNVLRDRKRVPMVVFKCGLVNLCMHPLLVAPSKASKKAIQQVADQITGWFDMIYAKKFHNFSFLSNDLPFERTLRAYCEERYSGGKLLTTAKLNAFVMIKIEQGDLLAGLEYLMGRSKFGETAVELILSESSTPSSSSSCQVTIEPEFRLRAATMLRTLWDEHHSSPLAPLSHEQRYQECVEAFPRLFGAMQTFLECPATIKWRCDNSNLGGSSYCHLHSVWRMPSTFEYLLKGDFNAVLEKVNDKLGHQGTRARTRIW